MSSYQPMPLHRETERLRLQPSRETVFMGSHREPAFAADPQTLADRIWQIVQGRLAQARPG